MVVESHHGPGVDDLGFFADHSLRSTVVMLVKGQIDMIILGKGQLDMVSEFQTYGGERVKQGGTDARNCFSRQ